MNYEIVWFFLDYVIRFLENLSTCTTWEVHSFYFLVNTETFLRDTIYYGVSGQYYFFFFPTQGFCLSFPFLELGLEFAFSVCNVSSFAVTASKFAELVLLLYYYY